MAVIEMNRTAAAPVGTSGSIFGKAFAAFTAWNTGRATRKALNNLTDRELDDIGLTRGEIEAVVGRLA